MKPHPDHGVNPHYAFCNSCGGPTDEFYLLGIHNEIYTCPRCTTRHLGIPTKTECSSCGHPFSPGKWHIRNLKAGESIPSLKTCSYCVDTTPEERLAVSQGGVYYTCKCGEKGVIPPNDPFSSSLRKYLEIPAPANVKYELTFCKKCRPE